MYYVNVLVFGIQHFYYVLVFIILLTRRVVAQEVHLCNLWVTFWTGGCVTKTTWLVINLLVS